jgi:hypothetical protein
MGHVAALRGSVQPGLPLAALVPKVAPFWLTLDDNHFPTAALKSAEIYSNLVNKRTSYRIDLRNVTLKAECIDIV